MTQVCAVVVAAYKAERWIGECLASIRAQEPLEGWRYELRVGVDGCEGTSTELMRLGVGHWFSSENVGPYRIRNTLTRDADAVAIFDADDVMHQADYLSTLIPLAGDGISGAARVDVDEEGRPIAEAVAWKVGVAVFSATAMSAIGGFRPWRIAADRDAIARAKRLGVPVSPTKDTYYHRRIHPGSLTAHEVMGHDKPGRRRAYAEIEKLLRAEDYKVEPATVAMEWRA